MAQYIMTFVTAYGTIVYPLTNLHVYTKPITQVYPALHITIYSSISCTIYYTYSSISCTIHYTYSSISCTIYCHLLKYILHYILPLTQVYPPLHITIYSSISCTIYYTYSSISCIIYYTYSSISCTIYYTYSSVSCTIHYTYSSISCTIYYHLLNYILHYILCLYDVFTYGAVPLN